MLNIKTPIITTMAINNGFLLDMILMLGFLNFDFIKDKYLIKGEMGFSFIASSLSPARNASLRSTCVAGRSSACGLPYLIIIAEILPSSALCIFGARDSVISEGKESLRAELSSSLETTSDNELNSALNDSLPSEITESLA